MTVLYVEDDLDILETMVQIIADKFKHIITAKDGQEALELFLKNSHIDLIITDINMPKMNGIQLIQEIKKLNPNIPILITSAHSDYNYFIQSIQLKVDGYILKPVDMRQLIFEIEKVQKNIQIKKEFKKNEKLLLEYKQLIDESSIVSKTDTKGIITYVNDAFCKISGYTKNELIGKKHNIIRHPDTPASVFENLWEIIQNKNPWKGIIKNKKKNGDFYYVNSYILPIINDQGDIDEFIAIRHDITIEIEYQNSLQEKVNEQISKIRDQDNLIHQQSKLAAMGEMIDAIAHQWKQPINIIKMKTEMIGYDFEDKALQKEDLKEFQEGVFSQINHLLSTLEEFRNFLRPNKINKSFSVVEAIQSVQTIMQDELMNYSLTLNITPTKDFIINGSENELKHVIINLINNSKDAFIENNIENKQINIIINEKQIEFLDNAGGIPEHIIDRIFEANFTTKEIEVGTGIGLYMSKQLIEKLGGTISVTNSNNGAKFLITLPH